MTAHPLAMRRLLLVLLAFLSIWATVDNLGRTLANPDEGRYSEISREMAASGDWVTPRLNGLKYFEKPPLQYWASAVSFKLFGENEYAARLYVALAGLLTLLVAGGTAARLAGFEAGAFTFLALMASPYFIGLAGVVTLDAGLTLWLTLALCAFLLSQAPPRSATSRRNWLLLAWAAMALAALSKGLIGLAFPAATLLLYCAVERNFRMLAKLEWVRGPLVFLAIAAPWHVAVSIANPEFPYFYFVHEHFLRFLTTEHRRVQEWWFFLPILFGGFAPWTLLLLPACVSGWREPGLANGFRPLRFALLWSAFILAFFSASGSKLPAYILPIFPALGLVLGAHLARTPGPRIAPWILPIAPLALFGAWAAWKAPERIGDAWTWAMYNDASGEIMAGALLVFAGTVVAWLFLRRDRKWTGVIVLAASTTLLVSAIEDGYEDLSPRQSAKLVAAKMRPLLQPGTAVYSVKHYEQSLPFYIGRTVTLVDYVDEFDLGIRQEPAKAIADLATFRAEWLRQGDAMAIMHPDIYQDLRIKGLPMQLLHEDLRRVLVRKP
jgi:4-amino-4-deoxy-L-arabinose transferase-like glycosyltransferase